MELLVEWSLLILFKKVAIKISHFFFSSFVVFFTFRILNFFSLSHFSPTDSIYLFLRLPVLFHVLSMHIITTIDLLLFSSPLCFFHSMFSVVFRMFYVRKVGKKKSQAKTQLTRSMTMTVHLIVAHRQVHCNCN